MGQEAHTGEHCLVTLTQDSTYRNTYKINMSMFIFQKTGTAEKGGEKKTVSGLSLHPQELSSVVQKE